MIQTEMYRRTSFIVDAIQVTEDNMEEVAAWCAGRISETTPKKGEPAKFIKVHVLHPISLRQTQAFVGDWVLYATNGFKVYKDKAFKRSFELASEPKEQDTPLPFDTIEENKQKEGVENG